jgi:mannonate dehydratase
MSVQQGYPSATIPGYVNETPGIQIGTQMRPDASEEEMTFARQLGVQWVMTGLSRDEDHSLESYIALKKRFEDHGLRIYRLHHHGCHNMEEVTLGLPGREEKIATYLQYIRNLGAAGIHYSTYAHMANGIWSTGRGKVRGGAEGRAFHLEDAQEGWWIDKRWFMPLTHGRRYSEQELWDHYAYFMERVVPVAEDAGVYIGIHPDDPPVYDLGGIPRCLFGSFEGYRRALEMADSAHIGMCLCVGCWLEGGPAMGNDAVETIRYFGSRKKLFKVHFRNVTAPMPEGFVETFLDDGYGDMVAIMYALREVGFDGAVISDHLQSMAGGRFAAEGYAIGYMRGLLQAANRAFEQGQ